MRWLYVPNEAREGDQIGPRRAFERLFAKGVFSHYEAYSYLVRNRELTDHAAALEDFVQAARAFQPDVIFIQRPTTSYAMDREFVRRLKAEAGNPKLVLYEEDPYDRFIKRYDSTISAVMQEADMTFLGGTGYLLDLAHKAGARHVRFAPHSYDDTRWDTPWVPTRTRQWDAVMIGNLTCLKRIPFLFMPGGASRKKAARHLHRHHAERFALFGAGQGWDGEPYCRGRVEYNRQSDVIRDSWVSVNWGQFDRIGMYCSDRLPISLACGVPHITNYQPGYEHIYEGVPGLFIVKHPHEIADVVTYIVSLPIDERIALGQRAAEYARSHFEAKKVYADIVGVVAEQVLGRELSLAKEALSCT